MENNTNNQNKIPEPAHLPVQITIDSIADAATLLSSLGFLLMLINENDIDRHGATPIISSIFEIGLLVRKLSEAVFETNQDAIEICLKLCGGLNEQSK